MEGITLHMEKTIILPPATARTDYFRPYGMKRSQTDLTLSARKRYEKVDFDARQNSRGNHVPVVSVQYDVPKTPPSPLMYRIRKLHTQLSSGQNGRSKSEDRISKYNFHFLNMGSSQNYFELSTLPNEIRVNNSQCQFMP